MTQGSPGTGKGLASRLDGSAADSPLRIAAVVPQEGRDARPLRILIVTDEMEVGGSQRQIVGLMRHLPPAACAVELAYFRRPSFFVDDLLRDGFRVHRIEKRWRLDPRLLWRLGALLRRGRFDVVHCFTLDAEFHARLATWLVGRAALVVSMRDTGQGLTPRQWRVKRRVCQVADAVIANSTRAAERLREAMGRRPVRIRVIPNGVEAAPVVDAGTREALRAQMGGTADRAVVLFVGRLAEQKNVDLLLDALAAVTPSGRPCVAIVGSGPLRSRLEARVASLGLGAEVRFLGERQDARLLMQAADALCLPSRDEGLPNVVLEAMSAGLPVLATRVGDNAAVVAHGETGVLVESGDAAALGEALRRVQLEPPWRRALGAAGKARVEGRYTLDALARETLACYRELTAHDRRQRR